MSISTGYDPTKEVIKITDRMGFVYEVDIEHSTEHGFSTARFRGRIIGQVELNKLHPPFSDDDRDWEDYEQRFDDWRCEILLNMKPICEEHFNNKI